MTSRTIVGSRWLQLVAGLALSCLPWTAMGQNWNSGAPATQPRTAEATPPATGYVPRDQARLQEPVYRTGRSAQGEQPPSQAPQAPGAPTIRYVGPQRPADPPATPPPIQLTAEEEEELNQLLLAWEKNNQGIKRFDCRFTRWLYDDFVDGGRTPKAVENGTLKYAAPDKGFFDVEGQQPERWVCDGKSIFQYDFAVKQIVEHRLPEELQGKAITNGPLPFLFGAEAAKLKQRYFLKVIPQPNLPNKIFLVAFPRYRQDAQNFSKAEMILTREGLRPEAIRTYQPSGTSFMSYQFRDVQLNTADPLRRLGSFGGIFNTDPFQPTPPKGERDWKLVQGDQPETAAGRPAQPPQRR
jgi:TIGR03009 family protein